MEVTLQARNLEMSDSLKDYVMRKIDKLSKYFRQPLQVQVMLSSEKDRQIVEVTIPIGDLIIRGEDETNDIYSSVDRVVDKVERQIHKYKTKINRKARRTGARHRVPPQEALIMDEDDGAEDQDEPRVVKSKRFPMKPMHVEEAILQMNLLGHDFFVFTNADTDRMNVVYRRKDNDYGLIEPD